MQWCTNKGNGKKPNPGTMSETPQPKAEAQFCNFALQMRLYLTLLKSKEYFQTAKNGRAVLVLCLGRATAKGEHFFPYGLVTT